MDPRLDAKWERWMYYRQNGHLQILYEGAPIKVLLGAGTAGFDRSIARHPEHKYVFLDESLSLGDATDIVEFWRSMDPRTPTDYVIVSTDGRYYSFPANPPRKELPVDVLQLVTTDRARNAIPNKP